MCKLSFSRLFSARSVISRLFIPGLIFAGVAFTCVIFAGLACQAALAGDDAALPGGEVALSSGDAALPGGEVALSGGEGVVLPGGEGRFSLGAVKHGSVNEQSSLKMQEPELVPERESLSGGQGNLSASLAGLSSTDSQGELVEYEIDWSPWFSKLADRWHVHLRKLERKRNIVFVTTGPARIRFTCFSDGSIGFVSLQKSSGVNEYDSMQIRALLACSPLPPFPSGTKRSKITVVQGWESRRKRLGEKDFEPGSFGKEYPKECISKWIPWI